MITKIATAVASDAGVEPTDLPPLWTELDPDALERLVESDSDSLTVSFEYYGRRVEVRPDREVHVRPERDRE